MACVRATDVVVPREYLHVCRGVLEWINYAYKKGGRR